MKKIINNKYLFGLIILLVGFFIGWLLRPSEKPAGEPAGHQHTESENQTWTCSMHPQIRQPEPGKCPICGMDLIPVSKSGSSGQDNPMVFEMTPEAVAISNIHTSAVTAIEPEKTVHLTGKIAANEQSLATVTSKFSGRIEKLFINFTGQEIKPGQHLATVYSPELVSAQRELLEAGKARDIYPELYEAAKQKLRNWKITNEQIDEIEKTGEVQTVFSVISSSGGIVTERLVAEGDYVSTGTPLFRVANLTRVWVLLDVYESDLAFVTTGTEVKFTVPALPGETFTATINFIDPVINPQTRVAQARAEIRNSDRKLKPEMFVNATVFSKLKVRENTIAIPKTALLWSGRRSVVYVKVPDAETPSFEMREVTLGPLLGEMYAVTSGLAPGEEIVTNGTFTVDAAAQLQGNYSMMNTEGTAGSVPQHDHGGTAAPSAPRSVEITASGEVKTALTEIINEYISLKNALVAADHPKATASAKALEKEIKETPMDIFDEKGHQLWMKHSDRLRNTSAAIAESKSIDDARKHFIVLNEAVTDLYSKVKGLGKTLYLQHCPMANDDKGADWLSLEKEIKNPYYGDMMLTCGEVKRTLK